MLESTSPAMSISDLMPEQSGMRHLLDEVPAGLARYDADGRLLACNPQWRRIMGEVPERAEDLVFRPLFANPARVTDNRSPILRALAGERVHGEEYEVPQGERGARWIRLSCAAAGDNGGGVWLLAVDVAEPRNLDVLRDQVLGVVAHDLRNPMSAMRMTLAMLSKKTELPLERRLALAERMTGTLGRMEALVNTLAEYARADAGVDLRLDRTPGNLGVLYDRVRPDLEVLFPGRTIEVERRGDLEGNWDLPRLERVLSHLLTNALKHGREDTPVKVLLDGTTADELTIVVQNQGTPIPAELLPLVYEPFTTSAIDSNGRRRAIGLGLFVVRHLVAAHGGSIRLSSTAEAGTTVTVGLPRGGGTVVGASSGELPASAAGEQPTGATPRDPGGV